jgi:hypothetical protein
LMLSCVLPAPEARWPVSHASSRGRSPRCASCSPIRWAALCSYIKTGELKAEGSSITEGIGSSRLTANLEGAPIDDALQVRDQECVSMVYHLLRHEGLFVGGSTGINVCAAVRLARELGPRHTIVTLLCDRGSLYLGRRFNPEFLASKGLRAEQEQGVCAELREAC